MIKKGTINIIEKGTVYLRFNSNEKVWQKPPDRDSKIHIYNPDAGIIYEKIPTGTFFDKYLS